MKAAAYGAAPATGMGTTLAPALEALRGLRPRHLGAALVASFLFAILRAFYLVWNHVGGQALLPKLPGFLFSGACLVLAIVIADAYVRRGARPVMAYGSAVFLSAVVTAAVNWYLTLALGGDNFFGPEVPLAVRRTEILFTAILRMVESGFVAAAYLRWREREAISSRLQASELRRAQDSGTCSRPSFAPCRRASSPSCSSRRCSASASSPTPTGRTPIASSTMSSRCCAS